MPIDAVIVAAGAGRRMGAQLPKQYLELDGGTVLEHAICRLARCCPELGQLVVVLAAGDEHFAAVRARLEHELGAMAGALVTVTGGAQRQDSVWCGLERCRSSYVMVHDAARPLVRAEEMRALCAHADGHCAGAILAVPVSDTLKRARGSCIEATVPRQHLYRACTPQLFMRERLVRAYEQVRSRGQTVTDEAMAMECAGEEIALVPSGIFSLKITHREDLLLARALLRLEASGEL